MFHKNALVINCAFMGFGGISLCYYFAMTVIHSDKGLPPTIEWYMSLLTFIFQLVIFIVLISIVFVLISSHFTTVKIGKPYGECLTIAYKYGLIDSVSTSSIMMSNTLFPNSDKVQICYERKSGPFGLAHGFVIPDQLTDEKKLILLSHGYGFLKTKPIFNAVYISSPAIPWLSYFGQWLTLCVIYPKLYKYSKTHKLSAYPVVELYRRFSVSLIAPLSQQDIFVVPEAEYLLRRSSRHEDMINSSMTEKSLSTSYHSSRVKLDEADISNGKLTPRRSLSLISSAENTKISPGRSPTPLCNSFTAKIILKRSMTPVDNNNTAKPILVRTSTPIVSNDADGGEKH